MKIRRLTSLTATLAFVLMLVTSIILFITPQGRVVRQLKKQGIEASGELTLKKIAAQNETNPSDVYERIRNIVQ